MAFSLQALIEWKHHHVTKDISERLMTEIKEIEQLMGRGQFINRESAIQTLAAAERYAGIIEGINRFLEIGENYKEPIGGTTNESDTV